MTNKDLSFIIPTYGMIGNELTEKCVQSLRRHLGYESEIIVILDEQKNVNNNEIINSLINSINHYNVNILTHKGNLGFAKSCNQGLKASSGKIKILLNNDTIFFKDITKDLVDSFVDKKIAVVGGKLLYPKGTIQHGGMEHVHEHIFYHADWHKEESEAYEASISKYIIGVTGAFFAIRKEYYDEFGGLDTNFFMGFEDSLYCLNVWDHGYKIFYNANICLLHDEGATRGNNDIAKKEINREHFEVEKKNEIQFKDEMKKFSLDEIKRKIDSLNWLAKIQLLELLNDNNATICLRRIGAMGDCILLTGIIEYLARFYPKIEIVVLTHCPDVFKNNPYVNKIYTDGRKCIFDYLINFDLAYEYYPSQNIIKSYFHKIFGDKINFEQMKLLPKLYSNSENSYSFEGKKTVCIHMAKSWESRTLSQEKWDQITYYLIKHDYVVITLGRDNDLFPSFSDENIIDCRSSTNIHQCMDIIAESDLFISTDSGLFHIASCTDTPIIGVFTCVDPNTRISRSENLVCVVPEESCRFKLSEESNIVTYHKCTNEIKFECVNKIDVNKIIDAIKYFEVKDDQDSLSLS